jgi:ferredoxin
MGVFIRIKIDREHCPGVQECGRCVGVCPVNIFKNQQGLVGVIKNNEDECTLCGLCLKACRPQAIEIRKLY